MADNKEKYVGNPVKKEGSYINKNFAIFAFFLFLSAILWCLNELGKDLEVDVKYPANLVNPPKERVIANDQLEYLTLTLQGPGYSIFKLKLSRKVAPFIVDLANTNFKRVPGSTELNYFIVTSTISKNLSSVIRSDFKIEAIKPDTLFFSLNKIPQDSGNAIQKN